MSDAIHSGHCDCGDVRYQTSGKPLFVHCCHCTWCQRESGSAFALNAMFETDRVTVLSGKPEAVMVPSASGKGQKIWRCPSCKVALWSNYAGAGDAVSFVRVGTLEDASAFPPDIHIFTTTKHPWVTFPDGVPVMPEFYSRREQWPAESLERLAALKAK